MSYTNIQSSFKSSRDGTHIFYQSWIKPHANRVLVVQHGFGEHSGRYKNIVDKLHDSDVNIYALDARGHGNSEGKRGHVDQFQYYIDDLSDLVRIAKEKENQDKIFLLGHSLGGVISLQYTLEVNNQDNLHALLLSAPGLKIKMDPEKEVKKIASQYLAMLFPDFTIDANLDVNFLSRDSNVVAAYKNDKLVHGKISFQMGNNLFYLSKAIYNKVHTVRIPVLVMHGDADHIADCNGSKELFKYFQFNNKTLKIYHGLYHEIMNEPKPDRDIVLNDIKNFINSIVPEQVLA
jgi:acylglycerol lipase